ncbi:Uncharacterised protein [Cedecea neteri]|uniref:Uncharacterized protein n=1 Tax=Cedecea neteri TaxID=158822 RepID=A0A2X3JGG9_9ENTR|nr:Uncharacterised protein [Cedecea neteri]
MFNIIRVSSILRHHVRIQCSGLAIFFYNIVDLSESALFYFNAHVNRLRDTPSTSGMRLNNIFICSYGSQCFSDNRDILINGVVGNYRFVLLPKQVYEIALW